MIQILVLAAVAVIVGMWFYGVLGQRRGTTERPPAPQPAPAEVPRQAQATPQQHNPHLNTGVSGVGAIIQADPSFDPAQFLSGARAAYETIVQSFANGDKDALRPLLAPRVLDAYEKAIDQRAVDGGRGPEVVRLKNAEIVEARMERDLARIWVRFEAELAEGAHGLRETRERWTFERDVRSRDPNWLLAAVAQA
jgi:predicted lipid-binding transport protein (Tim44 family)